MVLDPLGPAPQDSSTTVVAGPSRRGLRRGMLLAGFLVAGVVIWQLARRDQPSESSAPPSTLAPSTSQTTARETTSTAAPASSSTTSLVDRVAVAEGLTGQLVMVTRDDLIEVDLSSGAVAAKPLGEHEAIDRLVALGDVLVGLSREDGAVLFVPADGSTRTLLEAVYVNYLGDDGRSLLVASAESEDMGRFRLIRPNGELVAVHPDAAALLFGGSTPMHDGKVVIGVGQGVGLIDPVTGEGRLLGEGGLVAANDRVLVRVVCQVDLACEWIVGGYDGEQTRAFAAPSVLPPGFGLSRISADGSTLVGLAFGSGAPVLQAIDLNTGEARPVDDAPDLEALFEQGIILTPDGDWLVTLNQTGGVDLISIDGQARHTIALALSDSIQALTIRS